MLNHSKSMPHSSRKDPRFAITIATLVLLVFGSTSTVGAELVRIPKTQVTMDAPASFELSERLVGIVLPGADADIQVAEVDMPFEALLARNDRAALEKRGMHVMTAQSAAVSGVAARLFNVEVEKDGTQYGQWILVFGNDQSAVMVTGRYPLERSDDLREPIRKAVLSSRWQTVERSDPWIGLSFRVNEGGTLEVASRLRDGVIMTDTDLQASAVSPDMPLFMISEAKISKKPDLEAIARQRTGADTDRFPLENVAASATKVAGFEAFELTADIPGQDGKRRKFYKVVATDGEYVWVFQGIVDEAQASTYMPEFRKITETLRRVDSESM